jgi:hypothetical protein
MWIVKPLEIADANGKGTGRWRLTAASDEDGGGPFGDVSHDHATADEALACEQCDAFTASVTGFPSRKRLAEHAASEREREIKGLVDRFLAWQLPATVCSDRCVTMQGYGHPRYGTNLLTADEARQMIEYLLEPARTMIEHLLEPPRQA